MHRYRKFAQISLIFSILNLVLAAPVVVQEIHEARDDEMSTSPQPPPPPDAMASPRHSSSSSLDGSTTSSYPAPYLSPDSSDSGYSWLLDRPPRLSPDLPVSLRRPASSYPSSSGSSEELEMSPSTHLPASLHGSASPHPSGSGSPEMQLPVSFEPEEIPPSPPAAWGLAHPLHYPSSSSSGSSGSDRATTETYSPQDKFTPSHHPSSLSSTDLYPEESMSTPYSPASGGSLSSHNFPALDGSVPLDHSMSEGLMPSDHLTSDGSPHSPSPPPTETPPDNAKFFNKNMMKKIGIVAGVVIVGGAIASIVDSQTKHHDSQDS